MIISTVCVFLFDFVLFWWLLDIVILYDAVSWYLRVVFIFGLGWEKWMSTKKDRSLKIMERWVVPLFNLEKLLQDLKVML